MGDVPMYVGVMLTNDMMQSLVINVQWFLTCTCLSAVSNCGHWLSSLHAGNYTTILSTSPYDRSKQCHKHVM